MLVKGSASTICDRMHCRSMALEGETDPNRCTSSVSAHVLGLVGSDLRQLRGNGTALNTRLVAAAPHALSGVEPYFSKQRRRLSGACGRSLSTQRVAVVVSGAVRSMLEPIALNELGSFMRRLRRQTAGVAAFAYLNTRSDDSGK